jgi:hypothetical protein
MCSVKRRFDNEISVYLIFLKKVKKNSNGDDDLVLVSYDQAFQRLPHTKHVTNVVIGSSAERVCIW